MTARVLLADDHAVVRAGFAALLRAKDEFEVVGAAGNGVETLRLAQELDPDVVLLDWSMPGMNAVEVLCSLRRSVPRTRVVILTAHKDGVLLEQALRLGAAGYIPKDARPDELRGAIMTVLRGETYVHPSMVSALVDRFVPESVAEPGAATELSDCEREVLHYVALGYTSQQIAEVLTISSRTVERYRSTLMGKLGLHSRAALVQYARETKLID